MCTPKIGSFKVRYYVGVFLPPFVPSLDPFPKFIVVLLIHNISPFGPIANLRPVEFCRSGFIICPPIAKASGWRSSGVIVFTRSPITYSVWLKKDRFRQANAVGLRPKCSVVLIIVGLTTLMDCEKQAFNQGKESRL